MWVNWRMYLFSFSPSKMLLSLKAQPLIAAEGFDWLYLVFFTLILYFLEDGLFFFPLCDTSLSRYPKVCFTVWKKGFPQFSVVEFPTNSLLDGKRAEMRCQSLQAKAAPVPPSVNLIRGRQLLFPFLNSSLTEKCSFEWTKVVYKAQLSAANSIG